LGLTAATADISTDRDVTTVNPGDVAVRDDSSELARALQEILQTTLKKITKRLDVTHEGVLDLIKKATAIVDRLHQLHADAGETARAIIANYKEKVGGLWDRIMKRVSRGKRQAPAVNPVSLRDLDIRSIIDSLKEKLRAHVDVDKIQEYVKKVLGDYPLAAEFLRILRTRGEEAGLRLLERLSSLLQPRREKRSLADVRVIVRDFFQNSWEHFSNRYAELTDWLQFHWNKGVAHVGGRREQLREMIKEIIADTKDTHLELLREAVEAFRPLKGQVGDLFNDLLEAYRKRVKQD